MKSEPNHESVAGSCSILPTWTPQEIEAIVLHERLSRYNLDLPCGPRALRKRLNEVLNVRPLPSESTIGRMLARNGLTNGRTGWYHGDGPETAGTDESIAARTERR